MKKLFTILLLLFFASLLFPQTKYLIYFKDKGVLPNTGLMKSSALFETAAKELSPRAIERRKHVMGESYVTYEDLPINESYVRQIESLDIKVVHRLKWFNAVSCYLTDEQLSVVKQFPSVQKVDAVKKYTSDYPIEKTNVEPAAYPKLKKTTSLNYGPSLTQNQLSEIPLVHDLGINGSNVVIGLLDTGFRWKTHPALQSKNVLAEYDFIQKDKITENETGDVSGQDSHGTSVFSIIGGYSAGNLIGPAYGASYILAKTEDINSEKNVEEDNYAAALEWMEELGVDISSSSLGYRVFDKNQKSYTYEDMNGNTTLVAQASNLAFDRGVSTFTSAGNEGMNLISSPGDAFNIIAVGAVDSFNTIAGSSSRGPTSDGRIKPEVTAMGVAVYRAIVGTPSYQRGNGTSFSAPIAAGVAALLKSAFPHLTNVQIRQIFLESGDNTASPNNEVGYGLISAKKAIVFPNLSVTNNQYTLHKIFINDAGVNPQTVKLNYRIGNSNFQTTPLVYDGSLRHTYEFSIIASGQKVQFYFNYNTESGTEVREPEGSANYYSFTYGDKKLITYIENKNEIPERFQLMQNYPNPFNPETTIIYSIPVETQHAASQLQHVVLKVYDILGREVATLVNALQQPGTYKINFSDQRTADHGQLASGVYLYRLHAGKYLDTKKMLLVK